MLRENLFLTLLRPVLGPHTTRPAFHAGPIHCNVSPKLAQFEAFFFEILARVMGEKWVKAHLNHLLEPLLVPLSLPFASESYLCCVICIMNVENPVHPESHHCRGFWELACANRGQRLLIGLTPLIRTLEVVYERRLKKSFWTILGLRDAPVIPP